MLLPRRIKSGIASVPESINRLRVYTPVQLALKYLHYWLIASNGKGHGIHSPFVFEFTESVLNDRNLPASWSTIEDQRKKLLQEKRIIHVDDIGAGSSRLTSTQRSIASIATSSLKAPKYARLLARIVNHYSCKNVLELGTSLGITSSYLATAYPEVRLTTCEGINAIADTAQSVFNHLQLNNIKLVCGDFDTTLVDTISNMDAIDLAYIDGNHREEPTIRYFETLLTKSHDETIFIFDDIHWSAGMEAAWEKIKAHPRVTASIDLFFLGIVLIRPSFKESVHFKIRY